MELASEWENTKIYLCIHVFKILQVAAAQSKCRNQVTALSENCASDL